MITRFGTEKLKSYQRKFTPEAKILIKKLPPDVKKHIRALTDQILENPLLGKPLQRELTGYFSVRHQHYRIIYEIDENKKQIIIDYVGVRKNIYQVFSSILKQGKEKSVL